MNILALEALYRTVGVPLWQHRREILALVRFIHEHKINSVLELGTGYGGSAFLFGEATGNGRVVSVDNDQVVKSRQRRAQPNPFFVQILGDSRTDRVEAEIAAYAPFDLVYFDAEHSYETAKEHYRRYLKFAKYAAQHDTNMDEAAWAKREPDMPGIVRAWREVVASAHEVVAEFHDPDPDPRFPRWGGISVAKLS